MFERKRGKLKIFMGYAAGVGKTYGMLEEAQERKAAGVDVVIGYFEPHGRQDQVAACHFSVELGAQHRQPARLPQR